MSRHSSDDAVADEPVRALASAANRRWGSNTVDLREMARILRRRMSIVVAAPLVLVSLAALFIGVVTPRYTATATVLVDPRRPNVVESSTNAPVLSNFGTDDATIESQTLLIQSVTILQRVVEKLGLVNDTEFGPKPGLLDPIRALFSSAQSTSGVSPEDVAKTRTVDALAKRVKVTRQGTTFLVDVNVSAAEPAKAARIANAIAEAYFLEQVRFKFDATKIATSWLDKQIANLKTRVVAAEKAVEDFRAANNLIAAQGVTVNEQQITDLNNKLIEARVQTAETRAKHEQAQRIAKSGGDPGSVAEVLSSDVIGKLRTQYADLVKSQADISSKYGQRHPFIANVRAQLRDTERLISEEVGRILDSTKQGYQVASSREASLQKSLEVLTGVSTESGQARVRLNELMREAEANRTIYESFLARYRETTAQESLEMPESRVVAKAEVPIRPSFPKTLMILALALVLGLGLGCVLAFLIDYLDRRVKTLEQMEEASGIPALAAIPLVGTRELARRAKRGRQELERYDPMNTRMLPAALQPPLMRYAVDDPNSIFGDAVRAIRLAVQREARLKSAQVVMVTSAIDGEGKTTLAANLALSLAVIGVRTILVECDPRNPELTRAFCPRVDTGLIELAMGEESLERTVLVDRGTGLFLLPSPSSDHSIPFTDLIAGLSATIDDLRKVCEVIILDAPPLVPLVDGRVLAEQADRIILAVGWNRTPQEVVGQAVELLGPFQNRILGTVLTRVDYRQLRHYDYYRSSVYLKPYPYLGSAKQGVAT